MRGSHFAAAFEQAMILSSYKSLAGNKNLVKRSPIVYLPIEFRSREFDGKALLATVLAKRGYSVVLGEQWTIYTNLEHLPPGAVLFKSFNKLHLSAMAIAKQVGHKVYVLEEELLAHTDKEAIGNFCTDGIFDLPDAILSNGEREKEVLTELSGGAVRIEVTGNPRIDILKPAFHPFFKREMDIVRGHFGDFILVNTNFGIVNSTWRDIAEVTRIHVDAGFIKPDDPASMRSWEELVEFEQLNKAAIIASINELCRRRPATKIVVRPHPAEAMGHWKGLFDAFSNVQIAREGSHIPWTLACKMLLHTSCTTGFEASAAGKAALSLVAKPNWISRSFISNRLNPMFTDPISLVDAAEAYLDNGKISVPANLDAAAASHYVWNIGDKNSVNRLAVVLTADLPTPRGKVALPRLTPYERGASQKNKLNLSLAECGDVLSRILNIIGKARPLEFDQVGDSLFYITPSALHN